MGDVFCVSELAAPLTIRKLKRGMRWESCDIRVERYLLEACLQRDITA